MSTVTDQGSGKDAFGRSMLGRGRFSVGKWYCECDRPAKFIPGKKTGPNEGRKAWSCAKVYGSQCAFFIWADHETAAKEWLARSAQPPSGPQTPTKARGNREGFGSAGQSLETPFTKAKRKAVVEEITNNDTNEVGAIENAIADAGHQQQVSAYEPPQPSEPMRKAPKTSPTSAPRQSFIERLRGRSPQLPTPNSRDQLPGGDAEMTKLLAAPQRDESPTPGQLNNNMENFNDSDGSDLITKVLELVRADNPKLKASTEMQLRHEVGLVLDMGHTKLRRCEITISELQSRVDDLETMVYNLT